MSNKLKDFYDLDGEQPSVCIVGMGYVGLTLAISLCNFGFKVIGIESNPEIVSALTAGVTHVLEPDLEKGLQIALRDKLLIVKHPDELKSWHLNSEIFILTVGTPILNRRINTSNLLAAVHSIEPFLKENSLIIVRSTVGIGTSRRLIFEPLLKRGLEVLVAMCPERTVEGKALEEIRNLPQIVGGVNRLSSEIAESFFHFVSSEVVVVDDAESAELIKLINNSYRDLMFAFSNEVTEISNSFGLSARKVINAANHNYPRSAISAPGPSGGPCLEKDPWILYESAASVGVSANIIKSARLMNENMIVDFLNACLDESAQVNKATILGLAFKGFPETLDTRGSHVRQVCQYLKSLGIKNITGYEPAGVVGGLNDFLIESTDLETSIIDSDLVIILTNSRAFLQIENSVWNSVNLGAQILDFWGVVSKENLRSDIKLRTWG